LGEPTFEKRLLSEVIDLKPDGSFALNLDYFRFHVSTDMGAWSRLETLLGFPRREEHEPLNQEHKDLAASVQIVLERALRGLMLGARSRTKAPRLCLAGGVAL